MSNPFLDALYQKYVYECDGKAVTLTDEKTEHVHGKFFTVICEKCCNVPVLHLLERAE